MKCYTTNKDAVFVCTEKTLEKDEKIEMNLMKAYPEVTYQEVLGMGGALTESAAYTYSKMSDEKKKELLALKAVYFGCRKNKRLIGSTFVENFRDPDRRQEIDFSEALEIVHDLIEKMDKEIANG